MPKPKDPNYVPLHRQLAISEESLELLKWAYVTPQDSEWSDSVIGLDICDNFKGWVHRLFNKAGMGSKALPCIHQLRAPTDGICHMPEYWESETGCEGCPDYEAYISTRSK
jgi:hypothetical protein